MSTVVPSHARPRRPLANLRGGMNMTRRPPPRPGRRPTPSSTGPSSGAASGRRCPQCESTDVQEDDGFIVCQSCFTQIGEANIVADVTFEEQAGGRSTVQGGFVSDNARHAKTLGAGAYRKVGGGERNSLAEIESAGRRALGALTPRLGIADNVFQQANRIWTLAANITFSAGRKTDEVVAACLYAACRRQKQNEILLMDIAELVQINVFRLGEVYKDLCKELYLVNESVGMQHLVELEPLIWKYCRKLQFEDKTKDVATDALKIMKRMNRDWIAAGRHPAGLCGACIILAARMNNFRRSVREVVYVSKVADVTIAKRVEEFRRTKSAALTVDEFRKFGNRIKHQHNPPSFDSAAQRGQTMEKRKQKRREHMLRQSTATDLNATPSEGQSAPIQIRDDTAEVASRDSSAVPSSAPESFLAESTESAVPPATLSSQSPPTEASLEAASHNSAKRKQEHHANRSDSTTSSSRGTSQALPEQIQNKRRRTKEPSKTAPAQATCEIRYDADGFAIPAIPIDPAIAGLELLTNGRRKKNDPPPPIDLSTEELLEEEMLEQEIESALGDDEVLDSRNEVEKAKDEERAHVLAIQQVNMEAARAQARRQAEGVHFGETPAWKPGDKLDEHDLAKEFENDPEVQNCQLSPEEVQVKERIWVAHNEDWLRKQAERALKRSTDARASAGMHDGAGGRRGGRKGDKARKRRGRMGDGSVLTEHSTPIETPADAARAMLEKRAPLKSMHVDFSVLERIYGRKTLSRAGSESGAESMASASREQTPASAATSPAASCAEDRGTAHADAEGDAVAGAENDDDDENRAVGDDGAATLKDPSRANEVYDDDDQPDDDEEEDDYRRAIGLGVTEEDEFGAVDIGFGSGGGDDYDEYE